jgi:hypothetical protein
MLDPEQLRAEVEAQQHRLKSPLWTPTEDAEDWTQPLQASRPHPKHEETDIIVIQQDRDVFEQLANLESSVTELKSAIQKLKRSPVQEEKIPCPISDDPRLYDAPTALRQTVCIRILPELYAEVQKYKKEKNFQTIVGVWEYLIRIGLWDIYNNK